MSQFQLQIVRLQTLPRRPREVWQGGYVRLPGWVAEPGKRPYRTVAPLWISLHTEMVHAGSAVRADELERRGALDALVDFACDQELAGYRPGKLEVNDAELAEELAAALAGLDIEVVHRESLLAVNRVLLKMTEALIGRAEVPGPFEVAGMTVDRMRSFAEAAKAFFLAAPWRHLEDVDLLRVETKVPDSSLRFATVLGAGGETFGLGLFESEEDLWTIYRSNQGGPAMPRRGLWHVAFDPIHEVPLPDADLWLDNDLPVAGEDAYPYAMFVRPSGRARRATPRILTFLEAVLRALADTEEAEMDQGQWSKEVMTAEGLTTLTLSLPYLLEPPDAQAMMARGVLPDRRAIEQGMWRMERYVEAHPPADEQELRQTLERFQGIATQEMEFKPANDYERAQDLCYQAFDAQGRRQLQLARQALAICPDSPDAHVILAERHADRLEMLDHYEQAVEGGKRSLGPETFKDDEGHFWGMVRTRPYMRALQGLAGALDELERIDEAIELYQTMLRLNPDDNQGARYSLLPLLIEAGHDNEAAALLRDFDEDENSPLWPYARALLAFRKAGDTTASQRVLHRAIAANRFVPDYLIDDEDVPPATGSVNPVNRHTEAVVCAEMIGPAWEATDGAIEWLQRRRRDAR